ncbi:MAG TPA: NAD(P)/FAD-dependent oxidoreductase [Gemmatimonadales bacterium]|nr:NAD(P)/FAD-dependent oxidoreductase [Gemmatimonadales bacterium]
MTTLVLGAGLAGLAAAERLGAAGEPTILLEARDRVGGRVLTHRDPAVAGPLELGAEWLDPGGLVQHLFPPDDRDLLEATGRRWRRDRHGLVEVEQLYDRGLFRRLRRLSRPDRPVARALASCCGGAQWNAARAELLQYLQGFHAADPSRLSLRWLAEVEKTQSADVSTARSSAGADRIAAALLPNHSAVELQLGALVREVRWKRGSVRVVLQRAGRRELLTAERAVVTLPLSLLQQSRGGVRFVPRLDSKLPALGRLAMGQVVKVLLAFDRPFWREIGPFEDLLMLQRFDQPFPTWWTMRPGPAALLAGWVGGPLVRRVRGKRTGGLLDLALRSLAAALDIPKSRVEERLLSWHHHDWSADPFSRGAYSYVLSGGSQAWQVLARPVERTLYFAGEATASHGFNATVEGAIASGRRAAREILGD